MRHKLAIVEMPRPHKEYIERPTCTRSLSVTFFLCTTSSQATSWYDWLRTKVKHSIITRDQSDYTLLRAFELKARTGLRLALSQLIHSRVGRLLKNTALETFFIFWLFCVRPPLLNLSKSCSASTTPLEDKRWLASNTNGRGKHVTVPTRLYVT